MAMPISSSSTPTPYLYQGSCTTGASDGSDFLIGTSQFSDWESGGFFFRQIAGHQTVLFRMQFMPRSPEVKQHEWNKHGKRHSDVPHMNIGAARKHDGIGNAGGRRDSANKPGSRSRPIRKKQRHESECPTRPE